MKYWYYNYHTEITKISVETSPTDKNVGFVCYLKHPHINVFVAEGRGGGSK